MAKKLSVVRVIVENKETSRLGLRRTSDVEMLIEQLRYAGVLSIVKHDTDAGNMVIEIYPPREVNADIWAEMNAGRMKSFGINAVKAPKWG
jgi:hypothetical protein